MDFEKHERACRIAELRSWMDLMAKRLTAPVMVNDRVITEAEPLYDAYLSGAMQVRLSTLADYLGICYSTLEAIEAMDRRAPAVSE